MKPKPLIPDKIIPIKPKEFKLTPSPTKVIVKSKNKIDPIERQKIEEEIKVEKEKLWKLKKKGCGC